MKSRYLQSKANRILKKISRQDLESLTTLDHLFRDIAFQDALKQIILQNNSRTYINTSSKMTGSFIWEQTNELW